MQYPDKSSFQILLQQDNGDNFSEYWQDQCKYFYDEISAALPESWVKPLTLESSAGEKAVDVSVFSNIILELGSMFCARTIFETLNNWHEHRKMLSLKLSVLMEV